MNTQHDITAGGQTLDPPTPPRKPHKLLWIDTETTALSRTEAKILEIGMIVTNLDGTEDGDRLILPVRPDHVSLYDLDPKVLRMHLDNGLLDTVMETEPDEFGYANVARSLGEFLNDEALRYELHPAGTNVDYDIDVLTSQLAPLPPPRLAAGTHQPQETRFEHLPDQRPRPRPRPLPGPHGHPQGRRLHPQGHQRLRQLPRHHASRHPRNPIMNPRKRIPATLTAILAILALTACGETPKGDGQGTVNNPDPGYVRWYELPDGSAAVRCFSDSGGASCDWGHIELRDKQ